MTESGRFEEHWSRTWALPASLPVGHVGLRENITDIETEPDITLVLSPIVTTPREERTSRFLGK